MQRSTFDKRLTQILSFMVFLAVMVGISALAVNRYLARANTTLIETRIPVLDAANTIDLAAQTITTQSRALLRAENTGALDSADTALNAALETVRTRAPDLSAVLDAIPPGDVSDQIS